MDRPDIAYIIRRANEDIATPEVRTEARLKRDARYLLGEPELIWTFPYQQMPTKLWSELMRIGLVKTLKIKNVSAVWSRDLQNKTWFP